jgi:hypothetical protein
LAKVCAANIIGPDGCWMLTAIVMVEDSKRYCGPVNYWNGQLYPLLGLKDERALHRVRDRCVLTGWLHYEPGTKTKAARYWVMVPDEFCTIPDGPCDEDHTELFPHKNAGECVGESRRESGKKAVGIRYESGKNPPTSIPSPIPNPKARAHEPSATASERPRKQSFTPPTLDDVRAYCQARGNHLDPQQWFDHYCANGWRVGRNPMKDWKAAIRTWEKNGIRHAAGNGKAASAPAAGQDPALLAEFAEIARNKAAREKAATT